MTRNHDHEIVLVGKAKAGDKSAIASIVANESGRIFNLGLKLMQNVEDAEDILQETFLIFINKISTFKENSSIGTWLYRIATNVALGKLRAKELINKDISIHDTDFESLKGYEIRNWPHEPEKEMDADAFQDCLQMAMKTLPDDYRIVFVLRDLEGMSTKETARLLNISESNVKIRLMRGRLILRDQLAIKLKCVERK